MQVSLLSAIAYYLDLRHAIVTSGSVQYASYTVDKTVTYNSTEVMPNLMGNDLPLGTTPGRDSGTGHDRRAVPRRGLLAERREPGDTDFRSRRTATHEVPQARAVVALLSAPLREDREPIVEGDVLRAGYVPRCIRGGCTRALGFVDLQLDDAEADLERCLVQRAGRVPVRDDRLRRVLRRAIAVSVLAVRSDAHVYDSLRRGTPSGLTYMVRETATIVC